MQAVILAIDSNISVFRWGSSNYSRMRGRPIFRTITSTTRCRGKVLRLAGFGAFVELAEGVEGLCHFSEVPGWSGRKSEPRASYAVGQKVSFKIIRMNEDERKIGLSLKAQADDENEPGWTSIRGARRRPVRVWKITFAPRGQ